MPVGFPTKVNYATGDVLSATNMNDLSGTVNLLESAQYAAGKNKIINGDFGIWQRGTSFSAPNSNVYCADRFQSNHNGATAGTNTVSQQTFTPGTAPVAGYEGQFFLRWTATTLGTGQTISDVFQRIEDVRQFAGQTVTVSFWMKSSGSFTPQGFLSQNFGSGGSAQVDTSLAFTGTTTTSWQRYSLSIAVPSISGKTLGANSFLEFRLRSSASTGLTFDIWGVQLEAGSTATPFQTATGTKQSELAACQRYYYRLTPGATYNVFGSGFSNSTTVFLATIPNPVSMRIAPTALDQSGTASQYSVFQGSSGLTCNSVPALYHGNTNQQVVSFGVASGLTIGQAGIARTDNNTTAYLGWTAEL